MFSPDFSGGSKKVLFRSPDASQRKVSRVISLIEEPLIHFRCDIFQKILKRLAVQFLLHQLRVCQVAGINVVEPPRISLVHNFLEAVHPDFCNPFEVSRRNIDAINSETI